LCVNTILIEIFDFELLNLLFYIETCGFDDQKEVKKLKSFFPVLPIQLLARGPGQVLTRFARLITS
jgi:hypothetical protein